MEQHIQQLELFILPSSPPPIPVIYDPAWDEPTNNVGEQLPCQDSPCNSVGEQVSSTTKKVAHQHDKPISHWIERYWVERGSSKFWYYRYTWMSGRKLNRNYIGSVRSPLAQLKKQAIESAIADGESPQEIKQLIRQFKN